VIERQRSCDNKTFFKNISLGKFRSQNSSIIERAPDTAQPYAPKPCKRQSATTIELTIEGDFKTIEKRQSTKNLH
jgi:hypothetical protein